jgi:type I restriction enzyme S subunit
MEVLQDTYKDTKIGRIPKDWEVVRIRDINEHSLLGGNYKNGEGEKGIPLIKMGNLDRGKIKLNKIQNIPETLVYNNIHILKEGDFLFNTRNTLELVGKVAIWRNELSKALYNSNLLKIDFNKSKVHSTKFMNYVFNSDLVIKKLRGLATGSTSVAAIYNKDLFKLKVPLPPLPEQQKIAAILSTVDEQINTTEKIIEKSKELKKGLMQKLFSEGIGHTEFKDTKIGRIPKDWEVVKITDVIDLIHGHQFRDYDFVDDGIPIVKIGSLIDGKGIRFDNATFVDSNKLDEFKSYLLYEGDVLMALTGATLGKVSKVNTHKTILQNYRVGKFVPKSDSINKIFLYDILQSYLVQKKMWALINQGAQPNIGKADFRLIYIPFPPLPEQQKIAAILSEADAKIEKEQTQKAHLEALKKGLMQQLLTGKKRVKV